MTSFSPINLIRVALVLSISPLRNNLINKGLIYSPSFGEIDFTVPHFDRFLERTFLK